MIARLLKYDIKKMTRILVYMYVISIALAGITRFINIWKDIPAINILGLVFAGCTYSAIGNVLVNTFVHILSVFIKSFYKDESYLTHTLPVKKSDLLNSKYISAITVVFLGVAVSFLSLFILFYSKSFMTVIGNFISATVADFNMSSGAFIALVSVLIFLELCSFITMGFAAIIKANTYNTKRTLRSFLWFIIFYLATMAVTVLSAIAVFAISGNASELLSKTFSQETFLRLMWIAIIDYLIYSVAFFFISHKLFNRGVNVD